MYPDNDQPLEDKNLLVNAIHFSTGQRAFEAETIIRLPLDALDEQHLAYLAVQAFSLEMLVTEDLVGWHAILRAWQPGTIEHSPGFLLDKVDVKPALETELAASLATMSPEDYGALLHIPLTQEELLSAGFPEGDLGLIPIALESQLHGVQAILKHRSESSRGRVVGYNKAKHVLVGLHRPEERHVLIPARFKLQTDGVHLQTVTLAATPANVRTMAGRAISTMAVLNATLGLVAWARYGVRYEPPLWARSAARMPIWKD